MLATPAWLLVGMTRNEPGALSWDDERLRFATADELLFDAAPGEVQGVQWPKMWFGGGCKITVAGETYRVSFVKPNGAPPITDALMAEVGGVLGAASAVADLRDALGSLSDVKQGREAGRAWKDVLGTIAA